MENYKAAFIIDKLEFQYFEFNQLVTSFWLIEECNRRGWDVYISTADKLSLIGSEPHASLFKTSLIKSKGEVDLTREKCSNDFNLNDMDIVFFRPDPPVDLNYLNCTYVLDFVDKTKTLMVNDPTGIRSANEKIYINNFPDMVPANITTQNVSLIKDFLNEHNKIVVKPLNRCFGKGVFCLEKGDVNTNSILDSCTNSGTTIVMAQEFLKNTDGGDKRVNIICGNVIDEVIIKMSGEGDFKFNDQNDKYFAKTSLTDKERETCNRIAPKLMQDGLYLVGLDFIQDKIIEINVTSPCFFIKEMNKMFNTQLEKKIMDKVEEQLTNLHKTQSKRLMSSSRR